MKKLALISAAMLTFLVSCKKEEMPAVDNKQEEAFHKTPLTKECYLGILKQDTIILQLNILDNDVRSGKLAYNFFEKDKSEGHLSGQIHGDTVFADYTFISEGKMSQREVVFLKKGNIIIEGYGEVIDDNKGKVVFKDKHKLFFDSKTILTKTDCK